MTLLARNLIATTVACTLIAGACHTRDATDPGTGGETAHLAVRADVSAAAVAQVVVEVSAPDIPTTLVFNIPVSGGIAAATLTLPAGSNRTITMHAYDGGGVETHRGSVTVNIRPGTNPTIPLVLSSLVGDFPLSATLGSFIVIVTPGSATVPIGGTTTLTATIEDPLGNPVAGAVTWAAGNPAVASITSTGVLTGVWVGQTTIIANYHGVAATMTVTVTAFNWPNEPPGFQVLTDFGFDTHEGDGWLWNGDPLEPNIVGDLTAPRSPPSVLQFLYPVGFVGGGSPGIEHFFLAQVRELYVGYWWRTSSPWQGHSSGINKISFAVANNFSTDIILSMHEGTEGMRLVLFPGGVSNVDLAGGVAGYLTGNVDPNVPVTLGRWHRVELYLKYSTTPTSEDGIIRWWIDGKLIGDYTTANFEGDPLQAWQFSPTWGGIGDVKTEDDFFWFDHARLSVP
jgi:hypothetical protein